ncbi:hypothetical protein ABW19_dt0209314 [Dactylella cylindrospora]|nr:hypothetical protein ABW19_dt0209314 [Dactylella cylindrospora]
MPKPKASRRKLADIEEITAVPPDSLTDTQSVGRVLKATGNNLYIVKLPGDVELLVELQQRFRSSVWIRRNGFVLVDRENLSGKDIKIQGEIINVIRNEKAWTKMPYWPQEFLRTDTQSDSEESNSEDEVGGVEKGGSPLKKD